jgi:hypothetical protein
MSDQVPAVEEQIPSIEELFSKLQGAPAEDQVPVLAAILQAAIGGLAEQEKQLQEYCKKLDELDQKFHGEIYGPLQDSYHAKIRGMGLESMKQKYGSMFDPILEPLKGFGIEDPYSQLYDMLEEMKKQGTYNEEDEPTIIGDQHKEAMRRINAIKGVKEEPIAEVKEVKIESKGETPPSEEPPKEKEPPKSLAAKKKGMSMRDGY